MPAEQITPRSYVINAQARIQGNKHQEALKELHSMFDARSRVNLEWSADLDEFVKLHAKLCVKLHKDKFVMDALSKIRIKFLQLHTLEKYPNVVGAYMAEAHRMLDDAKTKATMGVSTTVVGEAVRELTGASLQQINEDRSLESAFALYQAVMQKCLRCIGQDGTLERYYQHAATRTLATYRDAKRTREFTALCGALRQHSEVITTVTSTPSEQKAMILKENQYEENISKIMNTKRVQLLAAADLGDWDNVFNCIVEQRALTNEFYRNNRQAPVKVQMEFLLDMQNVCHAAKHYAFAAHLAIMYARLCQNDVSAKEGEQANTKAVLAVLCVPPTSRRAGVSIAHDAEKEKLGQLAKALNLPAAPTRLSLTADLQRHNILDGSNAAARELFARLHEPRSVSVCTQAAPLLAELLKKDESLQKFVAAIRDGAVRALLNVLSACFSQVSIPHFMTLTAFFDASQFASDVEPIIVSVAADPNSTISVAIDDASHSIRFSSTASLGHRAVGVESEFSQRLSAAVHSCFPTATQNPAVKGGPTGLLRRIEEERQRMFWRTRLCDQRIEKQHEREKLAKDREEQRKQEDLRRRQVRESERNEKRREAELRKVAKQVAAQEAVERRKWVIKHVMAKHKGFVLSLELANLSPEDFTETVTAKLLEFRRKEEMTKESDVRSMDYFERATREEEVPRREKHERELAEANERKSEERRENRRQQHKEDWLKAVEAKRRLAKFEQHRKKYEDERATTLQRIAPTKRDLQDADLTKMKNEIMAAQAREQGRAEDSASPSPPPATTEGDGAAAAPLAPSKGAWKPKGRS
jgi:hypothetical protein